jgi:hypothetical protein
MIADGLKIATYKQEVNEIIVLGFQKLDMTVYGVEFSMAAPFDSNLNRNGLSIWENVFALTFIASRR